jgi:hypothetical protein
MRKFAVILLILATALQAAGQGRVFKGKVVDKRTGEPVEFATVLVKATEQWSVTDEKGQFSIEGIRVVGSKVEIASLGYVTLTQDVKFSGETTEITFKVDEDNLTLESAVVTAQENSNSAATSRTIDKTALEHVQIMNISDISSLLPGGASVNPSLVSDQQISLRSAKGESGSSSFGTAIEVDGVRLSNNASFTSSDLNGRSGSVKGASTNNIASSNIESVEVITGVPSVEYGDMGSGVVKINTRKGKTPWNVTMSTSPKTKQVSVSKGFGLGKTRSGFNLGVLNASAEYTNSVADPMSPYTSYDRKQLSLTYSKQFTEGALAKTPLRISAGVTGNLGGLDDREDPDKMLDTWLIKKDNSLRANFTSNWLLSKSWITNLELNASVVYGNKEQRENARYHNTTTATALHATQPGYYISSEYVPGGANNSVLLPMGYYYNVMVLDDKPLNSKVTLKANWVKNVGRIDNKVKAGVDWTVDKNYGIGEYSEDFSTAPSYREWRFCDVPAMHNVGAYLEDNFMLMTGEKSHVNVIAGLRWDNTLISGTAYGTTSSVSPRFNAKWTIGDFSVRAGWGQAVKLPSFSILYPTPSYYDIDVFTSTADANNTVYRAYYVMPRSIEYNPDLVWQRNTQTEIGLECTLAGIHISLAAFSNTTIGAYNKETEYVAFSYIKTPISAVQGLPIPATDRIYTLDPDTGVVTVSDKTGANAPIEAAGVQRKQLIQRYFEKNESSPIRRMGLEWVIDFPRIVPINTSVRVDGSFYNYRSVYTDLDAYCPYTTLSKDGFPYKYIGWYYGGNGNSNGNESRSVKTNVTFTTHIPQVRMIVSLKVEGSLLKYSRALSERADGSARSYVLSDPKDRLSITDGSVYDGQLYTVLWPDYYSTVDDPDTLIPFGPDYLKAKTDDPDFYADLTSLVAANTTYNYTFVPDYISPYFSANVSVTKEIGNLASISFYANNFFNNRAQVRSSKTGNMSSVTSYIPNFYYGLTLRLKF